MGDCYSVTGKVKFANVAMEAMATEALQMFIKTNLDDIEAKYKMKGIYSNTQKGCWNIILSDQSYKFDRFIKGDIHTGRVICTYDSDFDASYGWHQIMENAFRYIEKYMEDGSYMDIYPGHGFTRYIKKDGNIKEYTTDEEVNAYFDTAEELYENLTDSPYGVYNLKTGDYLYADDSGNILHIILGKDEVKDLCWMCENTEQYWYDRFTKVQEGIAEKLGNSPDALEDILDSAVERNAEEEWTTATPCVAIYGYKEEA